jgi:glycosyltransferase involved in cell wall biosynthesis
VHLPVQPPQWDKKEYYLLAGAWVPYKRLEIAVEVCKKMNKKLIIAGFGSEEKKLRAIAGPHTQFIHAPDDAALARLLGEAQALLFPGIEDFGILPIEAMAQGTPVIAMKKGGALDYVTDGKTGVFFNDQTVESMQEALLEFESMKFDPQVLYRASQQFGETVFMNRIQKEIDTLLARDTHAFS